MGKEEALQTRLDQRVELGERQAKSLFDLVGARKIEDQLVDPNDAYFTCMDDLRVQFGGGEKWKISAHAFGQLCSAVKMPASFGTRLLNGKAWERQLLETNLNSLFLDTEFTSRRRSSKYLTRRVGNTLRGFLSQNFDVTMSSRPLLQGFLSGCMSVGARPIQATLGDLTFSLKSVVPRIYEPIPDEHVVFGFAWSNSDFGAGKMAIAMVVCRVSSGTIAVLEDIYTRVHRGPTLSEQDLNRSPIELAQAVEHRVGDFHRAMEERANPQMLKKLSDLIAYASSKELDWEKFKVRVEKLVSEDAAKTVELFLAADASDIIDLPRPKKGPDGKAVPTRWWAANVLSYLAENETYRDRKEEMQALAGKVLRGVS